MRTSGWICASLILAALAASGFGQAREAFAASAPTAEPLFIQFDDMNPCSGLPITVTLTGTAWINDHDGQTVVRTQVTVATSDGLEGRGTSTEVTTGNISAFTLNHMLTNTSGARIRAHLLLVLDQTTTPPSVRVMKGVDGPFCVKTGST
jgi:hypothetical protein